MLEAIWYLAKICSLRFCKIYHISLAPSHLEACPAYPSTLWLKMAVIRSNRLTIICDDRSLIKLVSTRGEHMGFPPTSWIGWFISRVWHSNTLACRMQLRRFFFARPFGKCFDEWQNTYVPQASSHLECSQFHVLSTWFHELHIWQNLWLT